MSSVKNYLSLIKFSHTIFAMPFAMIGFFLGAMVLGEASVVSGWHNAFFRNSLPDTGITQLSVTELLVRLLLVIGCMIFARSAAMAFNRYLDRTFDSRNPRTAIREIPAGLISSDNALRFVIVSCLAFVTCTFFINRICFFLSPVALFIVLGYSYTKRFTPLCHLILGLGLSLAPIGAYLAVTGKFALLPLMFSLAVIFWVSGFDIIYALQDEEFDRSENLYSIPAAVGKERALGISRVLHIFSGACVIMAGRYGHFGWLYWIGAVVFCGMLLYQQSIVKPRDLSRVNIAFMTANGVASVVFAVFVIGDLLLPSFSK